MDARGRGAPRASSAVAEEMVDVVACGCGASGRDRANPATCASRSLMVSSPPAHVSLPATRSRRSGACREPVERVGVPCGSFARARGGPASLFTPSAVGRRVSRCDRAHNGLRFANDAAARVAYGSTGSPADREVLVSGSRGQRRGGRRSADDGIGVVDNSIGSLDGPFGRGSPRKIR
jgi:hypothetical protein